LKRDAEIKFLNTKLKTHTKTGEQNTAKLEQQFWEHITKMNEVCKFLQECNTGSEFMSPESEVRVRHIGSLSQYI